MNQYRCETCKYKSLLPQKPCNIILKKTDTLLQIGIPYYMDILGCASHSERDTGFPNSTDLLLISHDEWKRREERKHIHDRVDWTAGWISGFLTSRKFVKDRLEELHKEKQP